LEAKSDAFWNAQLQIYPNFKRNKTKQRIHSRVTKFARSHKTNTSISMQYLDTNKRNTLKKKKSTMQRFATEPWSMDVRTLFIRFMSSVQMVQSKHIEFVLQYLFDLVLESRLSDVLLVLRCVRQSSCYNKLCSGWRLPFYIILETIQETIRQGWSRSITTAPLCTNSFVPKLVMKEKQEALEKYTGKIAIGLPIEL
jgi:hypothetical protein